MTITSYTAQVLDAADPADNAVLEQLRADPVIEFIDHSEEQLEELRRLRPPPDRELVAETCRWAYYPWRRAVVAVLGPRAFRAVRLDRNRNMITAEEQARLGTLRIGVAGLSVGHVIAHTLAAQGICGELRLADFDRIELSNLNRVPATVLDLGLNKADVAARRIAELDPYLPVRVLDAGLTADTIDEFLDGLDVVVEECDSLDIKASLRERARARRIPVLMATSDRGLVDVERFDLEPQRPILHGLLGDLDFARLPDMSSREKVPHMLRFLEAEQLSPRGAAPWWKSTARCRRGRRCPVTLYWERPRFPRPCAESDWVKTSARAGFGSMSARRSIGSTSRRRPRIAARRQPTIQILRYRE